ncbi:MAG: SDR family oxidoreductase [Chloroflexi bacterium]|nr:SDR family oxidoreductase [Chloroflexota bacterium]
MYPNDSPLAGRVALVTGVTRPQGIGFAIAKRLGEMGASLAIHSFVEYDQRQPYWDGNADAGRPLAQALADLGNSVAPIEVDLSLKGSAGAVFDETRRDFDQVDILVLNHAAHVNQGVGQLTDDDTDYIMSVNVRASLMLIQEFANQREPGPGGRVIMMTSGQDLGSMRRELAYAASKGAIASMTESLSDALMDSGITVNTVNPGPIDTGYATPAEHESTRQKFPGNEWGQPDDAARLIAWLCSDDARWITGQVINSEGGFRR